VLRCQIPTGNPTRVQLACKLQGHTIICSKVIASLNKYRNIMFHETLIANCINPQSPPCTGNCICKDGLLTTISRLFRTGRVVVDKNTTAVAAPFNLTLTKGYKNVALTRNFSNFVIFNQLSIKLLNWLQERRDSPTYYSNLTQMILKAARIPLFARPDKVTFGPRATNFHLLLLLLRFSK
jgi:hypothetical protein